jgi:ubiquitin C-terminal hydrolase
MPGKATTPDLDQIEFKRVTRRTIIDLTNQKEVIAKDDETAEEVKSEPVIDLTSQDEVNVSNEVVIGEVKCEPTEIASVDMAETTSLVESESSEIPLISTNELCTDNEGHFYCCHCTREIGFDEFSAKQAAYLRDAAKLFKEAILTSPLRKVCVKMDSTSSAPATEGSEDATVMRVMPCGLNNLGNTCFMNSTLQVLAASLYASNVLEEDNADGVIAELGPVGQLLASTLQSIIIQVDGDKDLQKTKRKTGCVNPSAFLGAFGKKYKEFRRMRQQDSHDFLRLLFNLLDEEHSTIVKGKATKESSSSNKAFHQRSFGGLLVSKVICKACGEVTKMKEPFMDISLPLSLSSDDYGRPSEENELGMSRLRIEDGEPTLVDLLRYWESPAKLEAENAFACEACPRKMSIAEGEERPNFIYRSATQQFMLSGELPPVLIFHLQRFEMRAIGRCGVRLCKDHKSVDIPEFLDLEPFVDHAAADGESLRYRLTAMVIHEGSSSESGHYVAVTRYGDAWWYSSDSQVRPASALSYYNPYLVFYNRI